MHRRITARKHADSSITLGPRQRRTVATAVTLFCAVVTGLICLGLLWLLALFMDTFSGVLLPLAVAGIAAMVFRPYYVWLLGRTKGRQMAAVALVYASVLLPLVAFMWFFGALVLKQLSGLATQIPAWAGQFREMLRENWPLILSYWETYGIGARLQGAVEQHGGLLASSARAVGLGALIAGAEVFRLAAAMFSWVVFPVYLTFFLQAKPLPQNTFDNCLPFLKPETRRDVIYLVREFVNILVCFFRGQVIVAFCQGMLFAVGFMLAGLRYGFVLGLALGFMNVIPYFGNIVGLAIALPLAFLQEGGGAWTLVWVIAVFALVQSVEGYYLTPKIMGDRTGLHPVAIILAVFFWGTAFGGLAGMVLAIPLTAFLVVFWRLVRTKYLFEIM